MSTASSPAQRAPHGDKMPLVTDCPISASIHLNGTPPHDAPQPPLRLRAHEVHPRADEGKARPPAEAARGAGHLVGQDAARAGGGAADGRGPGTAVALRLLWQVA